MICIKTVKKFCCEDILTIENYEKAVNDKTQMWHCHHKLELESTGGVCDASKQDLIDWNLYWHRPADELIFLKADEHKVLHTKGKTAWNKGKKCAPCSEETKRKISEAMKGKEHEPHSEEWRRKVSEAKKGKSNGLEGKHWKLVDGKRVYY